VIILGFEAWRPVEAPQLPRALTASPPVTSDHTKARRHEDRTKDYFLFLAPNKNFSSWNLRAFVPSCSMQRDRWQQRVGAREL
jgi:hypothetical protein